MTAFVKGVSIKRIEELLSYNPDTGLFFWKQTGKGRRLNKEAGSKSYNTRGEKSFICIRIDGESILAHRIAVALSGVELSDNEIVDHINRDPFDNRICNLRKATMAENSRNQKKKKVSKSGFIGVVQRKKSSYEARCQVNGKTVIKSGFAFAQEAAICRDVMAIRSYGEFAVLNFPRSLYLYNVKTQSHS